MKNFVAILALLLIACGCKDPKNLKLMGLWSSDFVVEKADVQGIKPLKGYLRLFGNQKYQMHFENTAQNFDVKGVWKRKGNRLTMSVDDILFQYPSELDQETFKYVVISVPSIREAFGKQILLNLNDKEDQLTGLEITLGPLTGHPVFDKRNLNQG